MNKMKIQNTDLQGIIALKESDPLTLVQKKGGISTGVIPDSNGHKI